MNNHKVAFIFSQFPCYDETFILREMNQLRAASLNFAIYSLKTPKDKIIHEEAKELSRATSYLPFFSLQLLGYDLFFLFRHPGRYFTAFFQALIFNLKSPNFFLKTCALWYQAVGFAWAARQEKITHVHGQWATFPATVAFIISKLNNIPFSFTGHAHDIYLDTTMLAFKMRRAKFVVTCTEHNKKYLEQLVVRPQSTVHSPQIEKFKEKVHVVYHGVDIARFRSDRGPLTVDRRPMRILSVGSLLPCKGFEYLIEACRVLKEEGVKFECTIAGGGKLEQSLKSRAASYGLLEAKLEAKPLQTSSSTVPERLSLVRLTGYITQDKLIPIYQQADVFVLAMVPEIHWGIPNVLLEAMAAGVPVICTMLPSIPELIKDGETGFIIPPEDPAAIAVILEKLYREPELRIKVGQAGRRIVEEKFDVVKNAQNLKELFEQ